MAKKKIIKMGFGKNRKTYRKTSNIVDIVGSMIISSLNSSSFKQIPIRLKNDSSLNSMLQHPTDIHFFNTIQELQLDQPAPCLQYPDKTHSKLFGLKSWKYKINLDKYVFWNQAGDRHR